MNQLQSGSVKPAEMQCTSGVQRIPKHTIIILQIYNIREINCVKKWLGVFQM